MLSRTNARSAMSPLKTLPGAGDPDFDASLTRDGPIHTRPIRRGRSLEFSVLDRTGASSATYAER